MIFAAILSALVLLGAAWGAAAAPQYSSYHPDHLENAHYHVHHHHHNDQLIEESSHLAKLEDPEAKR